MSRSIIPVGYDEETGQFVTWEDGDDLTAVPIDLFGRVSTASPTTLFSNKHRFNASPYFWRAVGTNHTVTHRPHSSAVDLSIGNASGDNIVWQTKRYIPYQAGKEQGLFCTWRIPAFRANTYFRIGTFDAENGIFIHLEGANPDITLYIRDFTNGTSAVDTPILRADWNKDKLDGTGPSGITLDPTNIQIFGFSYQLLAAGTVAFFYSIDGKAYIIHTEHHANLTDDVYMSTATLPIRFEIRNTAAATGTAVLRQICTEIHSNGGENLLDSEGLPFSAGNVVDNSVAGLSLNANTRSVLIGVRLATTFGGVRNTLVASNLSPWFNALARNIWIGLLYMPAEDIAAATASTTGGTWTAVHANSGMLYNTGITAFTASSNSFFIWQNAVDATSTLDDIQKALAGLYLSLNLEGTASDHLLIVAQRLENNNTTVWGGFNWKEIQ